jgi:hypothetical protein
MLSYRQEIDVQAKHFPRGDIAIQIPRTGTTGASSARRYTPIIYVLGQTSWRGLEGHPAAAQCQFFRPCQAYALHQDTGQDDLTDFALGNRRFSDLADEVESSQSSPRSAESGLGLAFCTRPAIRKSRFMGEPPQSFRRLRRLDGSPLSAPSPALNRHACLGVFPAMLLLRPNLIQQRIAGGGCAQRSRSTTRNSSTLPLRL